MVYRCYSQKKRGFDIEARQVLADLKENLRLNGLTHVVIANRYDVEGVTAEQYKLAKLLVLSEPSCDDAFDESLPELDELCFTLAVEALPGQYDQRADSAAQCIQAVTMSDRPSVSYAKVYRFTGKISEADKLRVKSYLINPVDSREASPEKPCTLARCFPESAPP
ncbi:MAG: phosphoribosylformylglycinamidine synthase, partial [Oscillospiraceae bacterium]|nr:phosphoribosylformylglycinamidine synthase [Oscillospiraceae bacterium]